MSRRGGYSTGPPPSLFANPYPSSSHYPPAALARNQSAGSGGHHHQQPSHPPSQNSTAPSQGIQPCTPSPPSNPTSAPPFRDVSYLSIPPPPRGFDRISTITFSPHHYTLPPLLTLTTADGTLYTLPTTNLNPPLKLIEYTTPAPKAFIECLTFTTTHVVTCTQDGRVCFWKAGSPKTRPHVVTTTPILNCSASPTSPHLVVGDVDVLTAISCEGKGAVVGKWEGGGGESIKCFEFAGDGKQIIAGCGGGSKSTLGFIKLLSFAVQPSGTAKITPTHTFPAHTQSIFSLAISPNQQYIATGSGDTVVGLYETASMSSVAAIDRHSYLVRTVAISADSKYVASGGEDRVVDIADVKTGASVHVIPTGGGVCEGVAWHAKEMMCCYAVDLGAGAKNMGVQPVQVKIMKM